MGSARTIHWIDDDGRRLRGGLILPPNYQPGKRYPMVVWVYGGEPVSDATNAFGGFQRTQNYFHVQLLATRGYVVFLPDAPQRSDTPMQDLAKTVLSGVSHVVELGIADPEKLGLAGHSHGGYTVLSLLVQTDRFRAAMEAAGQADLIGIYGEMASDGTAYGIPIAESGQLLMGGAPWEFPLRYVENSPIFYLDRIKTPLLMVHGADDLNVASFLADEIFVGLCRLGREVSYAKYMQEAHEITGYANQVDVANRMLRWFARYLGPHVENTEKGEESERSAHHPKVVSSNLPPATKKFLPFSNFREPCNHPN